MERQERATEMLAIVSGTQGHPSSGDFQQVSSETRNIMIIFLLNWNI